MLECRFHLPSPISRDLILISLLGALSDRNGDSFPNSRAASRPEETFHFLENYLVFSFIICVACGICVQVTDLLFFLHRMKEMS